MARKKLTERNAFDEFDFTFDNPSMDRPEDFEFEFGADTDSSSNRSPVEKVRMGAGAALSGTAETFIPGMRERLSQRMPDASKFIGEVGEFTSDIKYLSTEFQKDLAPSMAQLKRAGRVVGSKVKYFLPKKLHDKYDRLMSDAEDKEKVADVSKSKAEDTNISASLDSIFSKNIATQMQVQQAQYEDDKSEKLIDRNLSGMHHEQSFGQLQAIRVSSDFQKQFTEQMYIPFLKKDLELKFRHYYATRDSLTLWKGLAKIIEEKLDEVRHNTAIPDFMKMRRIESLKENIRDRGTNKIVDWGGNQLKPIVGRIKERVLDPIKDYIEMGATAADMYAEMADVDDGQGTVAQAGGMAGNFLGGKAATALSKKLFGGDDKALARFLYQKNQKFKNITGRTLARTRNYADENEGTLLGTMASIIGGDTVGPVAKSSNTIHKNDPDEAATLTNQAVLSITTIMPGYLAKMTKHLESIATGRQAEELVYSTESNSFITSSLYNKQFVQEAMGSRRSRSARIGAMSGQIKANYDKNKTSDSVDFSVVEADMMKFIANLTLRGLVVKADYIAAYNDSLLKRSNPDTMTESEYEENLDSNASSYINKVFKDVKDPDALAKALQSMFFLPDGTVNSNAINEIENISLGERSINAFQKVMDKHIAQGRAHLLKDWITSSGNNFTIDEDKLLSHYLKVEDEEAYASSKKYAERSMSEHLTKLDDAHVWEELKKNPEWNKTVVGWVLNKKDELYNKWYSKGEREENSLGDIVPKTLLDKVKEVAPQAFTVLDKAKSTLNTGTGKMRETFLAAEKKRKEKLLEGPDELDPYLQERLAMLQGSGALATLPGPMLASIMQAPPTLPTIQASKDVRFKLDENAIFSVRVTNLDEIITKLPSTQVMETPTKIESTPDTSVVDSITRFENTFKEYSISSLEALVNLAAINVNTAALSTQMDALSGATSSTAGGFWSKVGSGLGSGLKGFGSGLGAFYKGVGGALKPLASGIGGGIAGLGKGIGGGLGGLMTGVGMAGGALFSGSMKIYSSIFSRVLGKSGTGDKYEGQQYVDIFRKGEVDPENPLVTASKQMRSMIVSAKTGEPLKSSYDIEGPLAEISTDGSTVPRIVVTQEDIEHGLVDMNGTDLAKSSFRKKKDGLLKKGAKGLGGLLGKGAKLPFKMLGDLFNSNNPIMKAYGMMFDATFSVASSVGRGIKGITKKVLGLDGGKGGEFNRDILEDVVGVRLDRILAALNGYAPTSSTASTSTQHKFGDSKAVTTKTSSGMTGITDNGASPGDADGDGKEDTIFEDSANEEKAKAEKLETKKRHKFYDSLSNFYGKDKKEEEGIWDKVMKFFKNPMVILAGIGTAIGAIAKGVEYIRGLVGDIPASLAGIGTLLMEGFGLRSSVLAAGALAEMLDIGGGRDRRGRAGTRGRGRLGSMFGRDKASGTKGSSKFRDTFSGWFGKKSDRKPESPFKTRTKPDGPPASKHTFGDPSAPSVKRPTAMGRNKPKDIPKAEVDRGLKEAGFTTKMTEMFDKVKLGKLGNMGRVAEAAVFVGGGLMFLSAMSPTEALAYAQGTLTDPKTGEPIIDPTTGQPMKLKDVLNPEADLAKIDPSIKANSEKSLWDHTKDYAKSIGDFTGISSMYESSMNLSNNIRSGNLLDAGMDSLGVITGAASVMSVGSTARAGGGKGAIAALAVGAVKVVDDTIFDQALQKKLLPHIGIQQDDFLEKRCTWYGVDAGIKWNVEAIWSRLTGDSNYQIIQELEDFTYEILTTDAVMTVALARSWAGKFGFEPKEDLEVGFWATWYKEKFVPVLKAFMESLNKQGVAFKDRSSLTTDQKNRVNSHISSKCASIVGPKSIHLNPIRSNLAAYMSRHGKEVDLKKLVDIGDTTKSSFDPKDPKNISKWGAKPGEKAPGIQAPGVPNDIGVKDNKPTQGPLGMDIHPSFAGIPSPTKTGITPGGPPGSKTPGSPDIDMSPGRIGPGGGEVHPMPGGGRWGKSVITSRYAKPRSSGPHSGIDLGIGGNPNGQVPVYAYKDGKVVIASSVGGYGNAVYINHDDGTQTRYGHLANLLVKPGPITAGTELGKMGNTGRSSGPHLHFELRKGHGTSRKTQGPTMNPTFVTGLSDLPAPAPGKEKPEDKPDAGKDIGGDDKKKSGQPGEASTQVAPEMMGPPTPGAPATAPAPSNQTSTKVVQPSVAPSPNTMDEVKAKPPMPPAKPMVHPSTQPQVQQPMVTPVSYQQPPPPPSMASEDVKRFAELIITLLQQLVKSSTELPSALSRVSFGGNQEVGVSKVDYKANELPKPFTGSFSGQKV